ncbi:GNAT family N-acetyltransferase [Shewanella sp. SNU WT4]|uniref:GNAT family N-acetyltransferase n=1 Tax=Shewanella sp. SNU WT4 TaxID=2590015 RepID=UPI00112764E6|nr:GNAT family N-acetyltransferase [Shewanella sp. SNU WT4]QDF66494.1 GNAT family N-acetyltransferase [Shewanella sp. SNU WT4]
MSTDFWHEHLQTQYTWVAKEQTQVIGLVSVYFKQDKPYIQFLFTKAGEHGVATALHQAMMQHLTQQQIETVYVDADVNNASFFDRRGFERLTDDSFDSAAAVCLHKSIS